MITTPQVRPAVKRSRRRKKADLFVRFHDECPRIGSGRRGITIIAIGRKWVRLRETATDRSARLKRAVWDQITSAAMPTRR